MTRLWQTLRVTPAKPTSLVREFGIDTYTLLHLKWTATKVLLHSIENSAQCYVAAGTGGKFRGEMDTYMYADG